VKRLYRILIACIFLLVCASCLQVVPITSTADALNRQPVIIQSSILPSGIQFTIQKTQDPNGTTSFEVRRAYDPDKQDTLYIYWFLDLKKSPLGSRRCVTEPISPEERSDKREPGDEEKLEITCQIGHNDPALKPGSGSVLRLVIADKKPPTDNFVDALGSFTWAENTRTVQHYWMLKVE